MTELPDRAVKRGNGAKRKRDRDRLVVDDVVTPNSLATHLGCTRQNIARLTAEAVIEQRADGHYDQSASRLRYIKHLREHHRHTARSKADAEHIAVKTQMLQLRLMERRNELMSVADHEVFIDEIAGLVLTKLGGWPARIAGHDLDLRRRAEALVAETRREIAVAANTLADECGEPALDDA